MTRALFAILAALDDHLDRPRPLSHQLFRRFWDEEYSGDELPSADAAGRISFEHAEECYGIRFVIDSARHYVIATLLWSNPNAHEDIPDQNNPSAPDARGALGEIIEFYHESRSRRLHPTRWSAWWTGSMERARRLVAIMDVVFEDAGIIRAVAKVGGDEVLIELDEAFGSGTWRTRIRTSKQRRIEIARERMALMEQRGMTRCALELHMTH